MRALVTGADGFVGTRLVQRLRERGWDVVPVVGPPRRADCADVFCDLADEANVNRVVNGAAPFTHVFHLAAITFVPEATADPTLAVDVNLSGTMRLLSAVRDAAPGARFLYVSTSEVYGPPSYLPMDESHPVNPANPYAITKAAADAYCRFVQKAEGVDALVVRPFNHSGPGQSDRFALSSFARQIAEMESGRREAVLRVGNLTAARDFSHVDDVIRAYELIAEKGAAGEVYNVCSGTARTMQEAVDVLCGMARVDVRVEVDPERLRPVDVPVVRGTAEKLTAATGWHPESTFEALLRELLEYWRGALS